MFVEQQEQEGKLLPAKVGSREASQGQLCSSPALINNGDLKKEQGASSTMC